MRLHSRIILLNALALGAVTILLGYFLSHGVRRVIESETEEQLIQTARLAAAAFRNHPDRNDPGHVAKELGAALNFRVTLIDANGMVLGDSDSVRPPSRSDNYATRPEVMQALATGSGAAIRSSFIYVASFEDGLVVLLAKPIGMIDTLIAGLHRELFIAMLVAFAALLILGYTVFAFMSRPLSQLAAASEHLAVGDLEREIPEVRGDTDLVRIGSALGAMSKSLRAKISELVEEKGRIDKIVETMSAGVVVFDRYARAVLANRWVREIFELPGNINGRSPVEISRNPALEALVRRALEGVETSPVDLTTGTGRILSAKAAPVSRRSGEIELIVVVFHDLTEIRRVETIRKDFVANVSHEFKTPLTSIRGYAETLLSAPPGDPQTQREFLAAIERNATLLSALVEDLLVLAQLEAELPIHKQPVDVRALIARQVDSRAPLLKGRGIQVEIQCAERSILADPARLARAFSNLLDNAIHYNRPDGRIQISGQDTPAGFALGIADTGFGIPSDDLPRVFERFYRVEKSRDRSAGGTGLGLAIAKHAIESQGGAIAVSSTLGSGSTFTIILPQEPR